MMTRLPKNAEVASIRSQLSDADCQILAHDVAYQGFFRLERYRLQHRLFAGGMSQPLQRELFERGDAAAVLLYDPKLDRVVMVEQFRIGALQEPGGAWLLEIVAGMIEPGETPESVVRREAEEEAGCQVGRLEPICRYLVSPGGTSEAIELFCGEVDSRGVNGIHGLSHEGEDIRVFAIDFKLAWEWVTAGEINSASPIMALQWLKLERKSLRQRWGSM